VFLALICQFIKTPICYIVKKLGCQKARKVDLLINICSQPTKEFIAQKWANKENLYKSIQSRRVFIVEINNCGSVCGGALQKFCKSETIFATLLITKREGNEWFWRPKLTAFH